MRLNKLRSLEANFMSTLIKYSMTLQSQDWKNNAMARARVVWTNLLKNILN
jgi:hypothetical protein